MKEHVPTHLAAAALAAVISIPASGDQADSDVRVHVDSERREVVVTVGPIEIPAATLYSHHPAEERMRFRWPVGGWIRGYRIDLLDSDGELLPREMLHHAGVANLDRRQLPYPLVERLVAVGRETRPVLLPDSMGVPMTPGQDLLMYYALVNPADHPLKGATLKLTVAWTPDRQKPPRSVFPLYLDANPKATGGTRAFEIPPGVSATSADFRLPAAGRLRALGAHLHDYAVEIRLEDVVTGKVLVRLKAKRHPDGRLISVKSTRFFFKRRGLHLDADHQYRVVGIYDNPRATAIPAGAMAFMAGPFILDDAESWPAIDPDNQEYQRDLATSSARAPLPRTGTAPVGATDASTCADQAQGLSGRSDSTPPGALVQLPHPNNQESPRMQAGLRSTGGGARSSGSELSVRPARPDDSAGLLALTRACPMQGAISLQIEREPDFFELCRVCGHTRTLVAEDAGRLVGCGSLTWHEARLGIDIGQIGYLSDFKVAPEFRRQGLALRLVDEVMRSEAPDVSASMWPRSRKGTTRSTA